MSWREQICLRILMLVASMLIEDAEIAKEIKYISNSISNRRAEA